MFWSLIGLPTYLIVKIPRCKRVLHGWQESVSLDPSYEQLLGRKISLIVVQVVSIPSDHIGQDKRVPIEVHCKSCGDDCG